MHETLVFYFLFASFCVTFLFVGIVTSINMYVFGFNYYIWPICRIFFICVVIKFVCAPLTYVTGAHLPVGPRTILVAWWTYVLRNGRLRRKTKAVRYEHCKRLVNGQKLGFRCQEWRTVFKCCVSDRSDRVWLYIPQASKHAERCSIHYRRHTRGWVPGRVSAGRVQLRRSSHARARKTKT